MINIYLALLDDEKSRSEFEELYINHKQPMYRVAYGILKNSQDAEDAVHQAFLSIANNFSKISALPSHDLPSYIIIVVRNAAIDIYNKNKKQAEHLTSLEDYKSSTSVDFLEKVNYNKLLETLGALPDTYRDILYLRYVNGFSAKEISKMLKISNDSVWKRTERAKKLLKKMLERGE